MMFARLCDLADNDSRPMARDIARATIALLYMAILVAGVGLIVLGVTLGGAA